MKMKVMVANETQGRVTSSARDTSCARGRGRGRGRAGEAMPRGSVHCTSPSGTSPHGLSVVSHGRGCGRGHGHGHGQGRGRACGGKEDDGRATATATATATTASPSPSPSRSHGAIGRSSGGKRVVVAAHGSDGIGGSCTGVMRTGGMRVGVMRMARWLVMLAVATLIAPGMWGVWCVWGMWGTPPSLHQVCAQVDGEHGHGHDHHTALCYAM